MLEIDPNDIRRRIRFENPWWGGTAAIDPAHSRMRPRAYLRLFLPLIDSLPRRAVILLGPRRVGKTVMIHHAIQSMIDRGVDPRAICYLSVDNPIFNGLRLEQLVEYYFQLAERQPSDGNNVYIVFDEIQYVRNWEEHLKSLVDSYPNIKFVASGSAAAALKLKSAESGAGRFSDFLLPPLTFYEYLDLLDETSLLRTSDELGGFEAVDINTLNDRFLDYLNFGGYPEVVFSPAIRADPGRFVKSDIIDKVLLRDLPSLYGIGDIQELNYLFTTLAFNTANEVSLGELAQNSGVAKNTIKRYIEYLEAAFLIKTVHRVDHNAKRFERASSFKVYLTNPSMRAALFSPITESQDPVVPALVETAVFSQWFHSDATLHYARWADGEVDIVSMGTNQKPQWAVEVKWSDRYCDRPGELKSLLKFYQLHQKSLQNRLLVTSLSRTENRVLDSLTIEFQPASVYCYSVAYNTVHGRAMKASVNSRQSAP